MRTSPASTSTQSGMQRKACKECRRLRLGCDREVPCYNCKRRGCSAICPEGTLAKGARSRSTIIVELQETITELRNWVLSLEEALEDLQASISADPHPLLRAKKRGHPQSPQEDAGTGGPLTLKEEVMDTLGTFTTNDSGDLTTYGPTASMEYLIREACPQIFVDLLDRREEVLHLPADIILQSALFPFPPEPVPFERVDDFIAHLPSYENALYLSELFFSNFTWCFSPITRQDFVNRYVNKCYPGEQRAASLPGKHSPHVISGFFMVCSLGVLADLHNPLRFREAEEYHILARASLCIMPIYDHPTIYAVFTLALMLMYYMHTDRRSNGYLAMLWGTMAKLCEMIGLNYDQTRSILVDRRIEARERLFWEIIHLDSWFAFFCGRPRTVTFRVTTIKRPEVSSAGEEVGWSTWKHIFTSTLDSVVERAFWQKGSTYLQIQQLEKELRELPIPPSIVWPTDESQKSSLLAGNAQRVQAMERYSANSSVATALLHMHLGFFRQALRGSPKNPYDHPFAFSVRTVLESAFSLLNMHRDIYQYQPLSTIVFRPGWIHAYSAAMALGTFVLAYPTFPVSEAAMDALDSTCQIFLETQIYRRESQGQQTLHALLTVRARALEAKAERRASGMPDEMRWFWTGIASLYKGEAIPDSRDG